MIFLLFIIIIIFIITSILSNYEHFSQQNNFIYTHQPLNSNQKNVKFIEQHSLDKIIQSKNINQNIIIDPLDFYTTLSNQYQSIKIDHGHFMFLSFKQLSIPCTFQFEYQTIGYLTKTDYHFIMAIIKGYRMFKNTIKLVKLNLTIPQFDKVDFVITRIVINSKFYKQILNLNLYIYGFKDIDIHRIRLFYPFVKSHYINLNTFFPTSKTLKLEEKTTNIPSLSLHLININIKEDFITRLNISKEAYDKRYSCYNDEQNINMALCNSKYDMIGNIKDYESLWDKKCKSNYECPFYLANKQYPNTRGGCIKKDNEKYGSCEMPVGVIQTGYTKYKDKPFCYYKNGTCENKDYAFPNDQKQRLKNKKEIIINM
jgi:hypothetical protein